MKELLSYNLKKGDTPSPFFIAKKGGKMRTNDFYALIELVKREVLGSETEYLKLLKVIGNNQRYDFLSQLSIYDRNFKAVACAGFDMWRERFHRTVMRGEKGIPILYESEGKLYRP